MPTVEKTAKTEDTKTTKEVQTDISQEKTYFSKPNFWKISSHLQLIAILILVITLAVTVETSVSFILPPGLTCILNRKQNCNRTILKRNFYQK